MHRSFVFVCALVVSTSFACNKSSSDGGASTGSTASSAGGTEKQADKKAPKDPCAPPALKHDKGFCVTLPSGFKATGDADETTAGYFSQHYAPPDDKDGAQIILGWTKPSAESYAMLVDDAKANATLNKSTLVSADPIADGKGTYVESNDNYGNVNVVSYVDGGDWTYSCSASYPKAKPRKELADACRTLVLAKK